MKYYCLLLLLLPVICYSQNRNNIWIFGDSSGIDFSNVTNPIPISSGMDGRGSCASVSDSNGNLLLYSFNTMGSTDYGTYVYNGTNDTVMNGIGLTGQALYNQIVILPMSDTNKFYIFHLGTLTTYGLYYSLVDMNQNNGLGAVIQKNIQLNSFRPGDCLTAVKHGNGRDWWVVGKLADGTLSSNLNRFFVYLVTSDSIYTPIIQDFNDAKDLDFQKVVWSPTGSKLMLINLRGYMSEFNFDRCSGIITLNQSIYPELTSNFNRYLWEGAYSASGNEFYVSTSYYTNLNSAFLIQYNLINSNVSSTADTLESFQGPIGQGAVRLAPDNKIYFSRPYLWGFPGYPYPDSVRNYVNENLSVINSPDSLGAACDYQPFSFYLGGKRTYYGLPNNPNYDLGAVVGSICDSLTVSVNSPSVSNANSTLNIFYHPVWQTAFINAQHLKGRQAELVVYDITGQLVFKTAKSVYNGYFTFDLDMSGYARGMYVVSLQTEKERMVKKMVRE